MFHTRARKPSRWAARRADQSRRRSRMSRSTIRPVFPLPVMALGIDAQLARDAPRARRDGWFCLRVARRACRGSASRCLRLFLLFEPTWRRREAWASPWLGESNGATSPGPDQVADDGPDRDLLAVFGAVGRNAENACFQAFDFLGCLVAFEIEERLAGFDGLRRRT